MLSPDILVQIQQELYLIPILSQGDDSLGLGFSRILSIKNGERATPVSNGLLPASLPEGIPGEVVKGIFH